MIVLDDASMLHYLCFTLQGGIRTPCYNEHEMVKLRTQNPRLVMNTSSGGLAQLFVYVF